MNLRAELVPPVLDEAQVGRLTELADQIDGASAELSVHWIQEFNSLSGLGLSHADFQDVFEATSHEDWVRQWLYRQSIRPVSSVTREELEEIVRRAMAMIGQAEGTAYLAILDANAGRPGASNLIFHPPASYQGTLNTYDPSPEEIVDWLLASTVR